MHRALAHAPQVFQAWVDMAYALREQPTTPCHVRELVILRVLHVVGGDYELAQHTSMALSCGLTAEQVEAVRHWRDTDVFDGRQRTLLAYADELVSAEGVGDATFAALGEHLDEQEIVELTLTGAFYAAAATVTKALSVQIEPDAGLTRYGSG
jgi:4-carboxymuconolactone decarboxylase